MEILEELSDILKRLEKEEIPVFLKELLTTSEINTLSLRWRIMNRLNEGYTQREIAKDLGVSLCKVTRGAKILKSPDSVSRKIIKKENNNDKKYNYGTG